MSANFDTIVSRTGISGEKLRKEIEVMEALQSLMLILTNEGEEFALYGGTALNKIYFGSKQRLSYDIDIESFSYTSTEKLLRKICGLAIPFDKAARFTYKNVQIDLTKAQMIEEPKLYLAKSLLNFFDYPIASVNVVSYSLEYLMARKTMALLSRMVNKDIYDAWMGFQSMKDKKKYKNYLDKLAVSEKTDIKYLVAQLKFYHEKKYIRDTEVNIEALGFPSPGIMVGDILLQLKKAGFG